MAVNGPGSGPPILQMRKVTYRHPGGRAGVSDIDLTARAGEIVCLLGPNGAGKSTVLRLLLGLLGGGSGEILLAGRAIGSVSNRQRARHVAYVPQSTQTAFPFTALDMAVMGRTPHLGAMRTPSDADRRHALRVMTELGIERLTDQSFASLSGGERALTLIARAVVQEATMLVLDEPTAALDFGNASRVLEVVRDLAAAGQAIVMTTHQPDHALRLGHRAVLMQSGCIVAQGPPAQVLTSDRLSEVYSTQIGVGAVQLPGHGAVPVCVPLTSLTPPDAPDAFAGSGLQPLGRLSHLDA